jgi:hypothetical protein
MTAEIVEFGKKPAADLAQPAQPAVSDAPAKDDIAALRSWCFAATLAESVILAQLLAAEIKRSPAAAARHASLKREAMDLLSRATMVSCDIVETRQAAAKIITEIFSYITVTEGNDAP